jgi:hypothetical protein
VRTPASFSHSGWQYKPMIVEPVTEKFSHKYVDK